MLAFIFFINALILESKYIDHNSRIDYKRDFDFDDTDPYNKQDYLDRINYETNPNFNRVSSDYNYVDNGNLSNEIEPQINFLDEIIKQRFRNSIKKLNLLQDKDVIQERNNYVKRRNTNDENLKVAEGLLEQNQLTTYKTVTYNLKPKRKMRSENSFQDSRKRSRYKIRKPYHRRKKIGNRYKSFEEPENSPMATVPLEDNIKKMKESHKRVTHRHYTPHNCCANCYHYEKPPCPEITCPTVQITPKPTCKAYVECITKHECPDHHNHHHHHMTMPHIHHTTHDYNCTKYHGNVHCPNCGKKLVYNMHMIRLKKVMVPFCSTTGCKCLD